MSEEATKQSTASRVVDHWARHELVYPHTKDGDAFWPPADYAPLSGEPAEWAISVGHGRVHAVTTQYRRSGPARHFALVDLDEGFRMLAPLTGSVDDGDLIGRRVGVVFVDVADEDATRSHPTFELITDGE